MTTNNYNQNPALRPTVLIHEFTKTVYRPSGSRELPPIRPDATLSLSRVRPPRAA